MEAARSEVRRVAKAALGHHKKGFESRNSANNVFYPVVLLFSTVIFFFVILLLCYFVIFLHFEPSSHRIVRV